MTREVPPDGGWPGSEWRKGIPRWLAGLALTIIALGILVRLLRFAEQPSLWMDELLLALNIATRGAPELLHPLRFDQTAAPLFLLAELASVRLFGIADWTLRLVPLVASIAALPLMFLLAARILPAEVALLPLALLAFSPRLIRYAGELKPYSMDLAVSALILLLCAMVLEQPLDRRRRLGLLAAGLVAPLLSTPAVFTLVPALAALAISPAAGNDRSFRQFVLGAAVAWMAAFAVVFLAMLLPARTAYLDRFWGPAFPDPSPGSILYAWLVPLRDVFWPLPESLPPGGGVLVIGLAALGGYALVRRKGVEWAVLICGPLVVVTGASLIRAYPLASPRILMFAVPCILLAFWAGFALLARRVPRPIALSLGVAGLVAITLGDLRRAMESDGGAFNGEEARSVVGPLLRVVPPNETVYLFARSLPAWVFYSTDWSDAAELSRVRRYLNLAEALGPNSGNVPSRGLRTLGDGWWRRMSDRGRPILIGSPTGRERRINRRHGPPDPGWGRNEATRIDLAAAPCVTVFASHYAPEEAQALLSALNHKRLVLRTALMEEGTMGLRYCRPES